MNNEMFQSAVDTGKRVLRKCGEAACDFAEVTRIKLKIAEEKSNLARKYRRLGKMACDTMDEGNLSMGEQMQHVYNEINDLKERIAVLEEEL